MSGLEEGEVREVFLLLPHLPGAELCLQVPPEPGHRLRVLALQDQTHALQAGHCLLLRVASHGVKLEGQSREKCLSI